MPSPRAFDVWLGEFPMTHSLHDAQFALKVPTKLVCLLWHASCVLRAHFKCQTATCYAEKWLKERCVLLRVYTVSTKPQAHAAMRNLAMTSPDDSAYSER